VSPLDAARAALAEAQTAVSAAAGLSRAERAPLNRAVHAARALVRQAERREKNRLALAVRLARAAEALMVKRPGVPTAYAIATAAGVRVSVVSAWLASKGTLDGDAGPVVPCLAGAYP
jgi:ABC-type transporter Mla subunit MlaD